MFTLLHKFLTENLISDLVWVSIDILFQMRTKDEKSSFQTFVDISFILFSTMIIILKCAFIWIFMLKFGKPLSKNFFLFDGLHP